MSSKSTFSNSTANSYALVLYELSKDNSELDKVEQNMKDLNKLLNTSCDFKEVILNPTISKEDKTNVISLITKKSSFSETVRKFLGFVAIKNRLFFLDQIVENFLNLVLKNKGELKAKLISSKELSTEEQNNIVNELSKNFKSSLNIDYKYDPDLIAGLTIQAGSVMVDNSIQTKLKKLEKNMVEI